MEVMEVSTRQTKSPQSLRYSRSGRNRSQIYLLSRCVICFVIAASIGTLFWRPSTTLAYFVDVLFRTYVMFLGTVMAHEGTHGHLGRTKATNFWWGCLALFPCMVPYTNFRKTHRLHHAYTNVPDKDPDYFLRSRSRLEIPFRALAMPHQWFFWLKKRGLITKKDIFELAANFVGIFLVYGVVLLFVGPQRLLWGMLPALKLLSFLLWYPFAIKTHEGYSTGSAESRSHDYYGQLMYWFSFGLSMHRVHHMQPGLAWIELKVYTRKAQQSGWRNLVPRRDIRQDLPDPKTTNAFTSANPNLAGSFQTR